MSTIYRTARAAQRDQLRTHLLRRFTELPMARTSAAIDAPAVHLQLVGTPQMRVAGGATHPLERKDAALLALLAVGGPTPRAKAASLVWPEVDDERARNSLRQRLFRFRRLVSCDIVVAGNVLRLADGVSHDLAALPERLEADPDAGAGDLLGNLDYADCAELTDWIEIAREQWRSTRRNALAEIAARLEGERQVARALIYAERLVADDPLLEHAHRRVMRLHYLRGDPAAALAAYERLRDGLRRELHATPGQETVDLASLIEGSGSLGMPAPAPKPVAVLRPPRLVGRESEWQALQRAFTQRRTVLVRGEPGIGKTRLLTDFAAEHDSSFVFGARPGDQRVPYALLARLARGLTQILGKPTVEAADWVVPELARIAPELGAAATGKLDPLRLRQAVTYALAYWSGAGLQLLALDDLHFADEASLELLPAIATAPDARLAWLLGARTREMPAALTNWLAADDSEGLVDVALSPLGESAIEALLASLAIPDFDAHAWAAPLARHTGGNPMFILETLLDLLARGPDAFAHADAKLPAPANIGQLIERRLQQLSPAALKLARVAAIAGQDFSAELAASVLGQHALDIADAWRELETAQVIRDNAFAHDLIYEATLRSVPEAIAQVLRRRLAVELETHGAPPARIAKHWLLAEEWANAAIQFRRAAAQSHELSQRQEEAQLLEQAVDCFEKAGQREKAFEAMSALVIPSVVVAASRSPIEWIERMLGLATSDHERAETLRLKAIVHQARGEYTSAIDTMKAVLDIARGFEDRRPSCAATGTMAVAMATIGRGEEAIQAMAPFRAWVLAHEDEDARAEYFAELGNVLDLSDRREDAIEPLQIALTCAHASGTVTHQVAILRILAHVSHYLGRIPDALSFGQAAIATRGALGDARGVSLVTDMNLGWSLRDTGRYAEALALLRAAIAAFYPAGIHHWLAFAENLLAQLWLHLGQPARAAQALTPIAAGVPPFIVALRHLVQAQIKPDSESIRRARAVIAGSYGRTGFRLLIEIECALLPGPHEGAKQLLALAAKARASQYYGIEVHALARAAQLLTDAAPKEAADVARRCIELLERTAPFGIYWPEVWWVVYRAFHAAADKAAAQHALDRGRDWIQTAALPNVPPEYRDSFLTRNPTNRAILTTASRRLPSSSP